MKPIDNVSPELIYEMEKIQKESELFTMKAVESGACSYQDALAVFFYKKLAELQLKITSKP